MISDLDSWNLKIFSSTGTTWFVQTNGRMDGIYDEETISCNKDIFQISQRSHSGVDDWEKKISSIKLKRGLCDKNNTREECEIDLDDTVGLKWKFNPKPKLFFQVTNS